MGAIGLNPIRLDRIGLDPIRINAIKLGVPGAASDRPYIDPEVLASLKAVCICYGKSNDDPDRAVVKNLVDPDNPFIISNAAFKLNSGFGEYSADFESFDWAVNISQKQHNKATISLNGRLCNHTAIEVDEMKVNIIGNVTELIYWYIANPDDTTRSEIRLTSGINTLPKSYAKDDGQTYNIGFAYISGDSEITIEQISSFEGAFVTDGIDDLITSTKTVQEMGITEACTVISMIHHIDVPSDASFNNIRNSTAVSGRNGVYASGTTGIYGWSKERVSGASTTLINNILGDKNNYTNGGGGSAQVGNMKFSVQGFISDSGVISETSSVAWYWTIIANKVLTTDQINQVIAYFNLDRTLNPDILCDVKKQGITNENHADFGDKLIDYSGNGRDIQLNNIAWKGNSGIGKYEVDFSTWSGSGIVIGNGVGFKIERETTSWWGMSAYGDTSGLGSFTIKVTNCHDLFVYRYKDEDGNWKDYPIESDGIYTLPASGAKDDKDNYRFFNSNPNATYNGLTVEQIPSHAGALCLDGVNDFGKVTGMPIYKDYTVIADYERFYLEPLTGGRASILSKSLKVGDGAFIFNLEDQDGGKACYTFGEGNGNISDDITRIIRYQSKYYNTKTLSIGTAEDNDFMVLGKVREVDSRFFNGAIYSLMSFPYSMSEFLIERQLKKHKLGTLYPNMVELRPIITANAEHGRISYYNASWNPINVGDYLEVGARVNIVIDRLNIEKITEIKVSNAEYVGYNFDEELNHWNVLINLTSKSPQKINITIYQPPEYLTILSNSTLISNETLIKNE